MISSAIASRYAGALADAVLARGGGEAGQAASGLRAFASTLEQSPELREVLISPAVPPARKRAVVGRIAGAIGLPPLVRNLLYVLIDRRRIGILGEVAEAFEVLLDERLGFTRAEIRSARELPEAQRAALVAGVERLTGKRVRPRFAVDESLLGGALVRVGSTVYDGSVRAQLQNLGRRMAAE